MNRSCWTVVDDFTATALRMTYPRVCWFGPKGIETVFSKKGDAAAK